MKSTSQMRAVFRSLMLGATALVSAAGAAQAQTAFTTIQAFGDSYADTGNLFRITGTSSPIYPTGRFSGGTNFVDTTSMLLGIPQSNFAIGGATTGTTNVVGPGIPGFAQEWQGFVASGKKFAPTDLVEFSIGGNDARAYYQTGGSLAGVPAAATVSATQALTGINALVGVGARTIVFTTGDVGTLPEAVGNPRAPIGTAFSQNYNAQLQNGLAAIARNGVRVESVDIGLIGNQIKLNPALYGFTNTGACPLACLGNPALQNQYLFYVDSLHLTSHGFAVLGEYIVNRLNAPLTFAPQGDIALNSAMGFASTLFGKLDLFRETTGFVPSQMSSYAQIAKAPPFTKAPPLAAINPWSVYLQANGGVSDRSATVASSGYDLTSVGGTVGTEYRLSSNAFIGAAFDYSNPRARLFNNTATEQADSYQLGIYGAWVNANFFAQGLVTFGWQDFNNTRIGVVDTVTSHPDGTTVVAGGKVGYLFDTGTARIGPIGGLTYARARINGYTESGDPVLTLAVGSQTAEALIGSVGAQFRMPFVIGGHIVSPYLNLTAEDDFLGNGRIIQYDATSAPLIVNSWNIPGASRDIYGRVAAGAVAAVTDRLALTANVSRTLGRRGGDDFYGTGGVKIAF